MIGKEYILSSAEGMHARPATAFIKLIRQFRSTVKIKKQEQWVAANSLLNMLGLGARKGDSLSLTIEGEDEEETAAALDVFFQEELSKF